MIKDSHSVKNWIIGIMFALSAQALFGTTFAFNKYVLNYGIDPFVLGFYRIGLATLTFLPFYLRTNAKTHWTKAEWQRAFFVGGIACAGAMGLEYYGTGLTTSTNATLIISTEAVFSTFLAVIILKEALKKPTIIGGICAVAGMTLVILDDLIQVEFHMGKTLYGDFLILVSVVFWGLYTVYSKKILEKSGTIQTFVFVSIFSFLMLGLFNAVRGTLWPPAHIPLKAWLATIYLGVCCSGLGHFLYYQALRRLPASIVCMTLTLLPVFGVAFSMYLLNETLTLYKTLGAFIIIIGVGYAVWPRKELTVPVEPAQVG